MSSVCIDLAKILKWGRIPVINFYFSFTFFKVFLFILTKFLVQAYILSMAVKSLMYYFSIKSDLEKNSKMYADMFNLYYRGIYEDPQELTYYQATL